MVDITVLVNDGWLSRIPDLVSRLRDAGMTIDRVEEELGVVSGSAGQSALGDISDLEGVMAVETARMFQLPPPDSDLQ